MAYQVPATVRPVLMRLAEVVLPIQDWVSQKPVPVTSEFIPALGSLPWRPQGASPSLSVDDFDIVSYLEYRAGQDEPLAAVARRWRQVRANPTAFFKTRTGEAAAAWRARRTNLNPGTRFGAFEPASNNFAFFDQDAQGSVKDALSREEFYDACWGPLEAASKASNPSEQGGWSNFVSGLRTDTIPAWPTTSAIRSSLFLRQFTVDLLVATLGQKNPAANAKGPVFPRAVLIEAGENRAPNNRYTTAEAAMAVQHFKSVI